MIDFKAEIQAGLKVAGEAPTPLDIEPIQPAPPPPKPEPVVAPTGHASPPPPAPAQTTQPTLPTQPQPRTQVQQPAPVSNTGGQNDPNATAASLVANGQDMVQQVTQPNAGDQQSQTSPPGNDRGVPPPQRTEDKSIIDHAKDIGAWAQNNYLDLAAVPIGLALMLFGGKTGTVLGALALGGGAYGLYDRFQSLNNMGGAINIPQGTPPEQAEAMREEELTNRWRAMESASKSDDTWNQWMANGENAKFMENLQLVRRYMPAMLRDQVRTRMPAARILSDDMLDAEMNRRLNGRLGGS